MIWTWIFIVGTCVLVGCRERQQHPDTGQASQAEAVEVTQTRVGGPFSDWLPLTGPVNLASHGHTARWGVLWSGEIEARELCGVPIVGLEVHRTESRPESEVALVRFLLRPVPDTEDEFARIAAELFGATVSSRETFTDPTCGEVLRLTFDGRGVADFYSRSGEVRLQSLTCLAMEKAMRERRLKAEQAAAGDRVKHPN